MLAHEGAHLGNLQVAAGELLVGQVPVGLGDGESRTCVLDILADVQIKDSSCG